ncbi:hypothetical protein [Allobranchiibius huperziae]|uniref:Uncharacterized protein n=1 Tax=Allobranchiibius huperziae TaxID=1874116 RepID=A0A853DIF0_9MICO|nr:hypothetical protein [Allobranchiibius huperziae]NYJ75803.1 hypothetical protein [Allobranchiibius huperziae]
MSPAYVVKILSNALGAATPATPFATVVYAPTRDLFTAQTLLGLASPVTTRRYVELPAEALREATAAAVL